MPQGQVCENALRVPAHPALGKDACHGVEVPFVEMPQPAVGGHSLHLPALWSQARRREGKVPPGSASPG